MRYDPRDPEWPDRDRFVLSNGHACILQYAMLHLTGYDLSLEDLRQFRQWGSRTPGHPEYRHTGRHRGDHRARSARASPTRWAWRSPSAGCGPPSAPRSATTRTFVIAGDGCFMEGISHEAASLAGHLGLGRLLAVYDDNHITIDGPTELAYDDDVVRRFEAYGWRVRNLGEMANDVDGLEAAIREALDQPPTGPTRSPPCSSCAATSAGRRPTYRHRGPRTGPLRRGGDPGDQGDPGAAARTRRSGSPTRCATSTAAPWPAARRSGPPGRSASRPGTGDRAAWDAAQAGHGLPGVGRRPARASSRGPSWPPGTPSTSASTPRSARLPGLLAGSADLTGNNGVKVKGAEVQSRESPGGTQVHYGIREHGMGSVMNGMAAAWRCAAAGRHVLRLLRLHAPGGPARRAERVPRHLLVDPRLHRAG